MAISLTGFLLLNLLTAARYPFVWIDEVMYSDPAVNLYLGNGFTSSAWYAQPANEFWAGNVPLHSMLLYLWIKIFGFSITAVRSINFVYLAASALLLWRACLRMNLVASSRLRLALLVLMAGGYSMIFSYRSGRPDCLALLLICGAIYVYSRECWRQRIFGGMALGWLMPWAGLQLLPLLAVGGILLWLYLGRAVVRELLATAAGAALGGVSLYWFYVSHGVWQRFLASVRQHTTIGFFGWLARGELRHSNLVPKDFSFMVLFVLAMALMVYQIMNSPPFSSSQPSPQGKGRTFGWLSSIDSACGVRDGRGSPLSFGIIYSLVLTVALIFSGKFPTYYGWMTYVPLCLCLCMTLGKIELTERLRWMCGIFLAAAVVIGAGLHGITALADWRDRDYANVEQLIRGNVSGTDWFYGEFTTYYAAKKTAARVFMPLYLPAFSESEKQRLTVLALAPRDFDMVTRIIGGNWVPTGKGFTPARKGFWADKRDMGFLSNMNYELKIYRRKEDQLKMGAAKE